MASPGASSPPWRLFIALIFVSRITNILVSASPVPSAASTINKHIVPLSNKRESSGFVSEAGEPVLIDPAGVYIRASPIQNASGPGSGDTGIIAGYAALEDNSVKVLRVAKSVNNAQSWQFVGEVTRADDATRDLDNAMPLLLPTGRLLMAYRNHDRTGPGLDDYTYYRITVSYSDDAGRSWEYLSQVVEREAGDVKRGGIRNGLWEPFLRLGRDGTTVQCYYSSENGDEDQDNLMRWSRDGGSTWSGGSDGEAVMVSGGDKKSARDGMTGVAEIDGDGGLICVFESAEDGIFRIARVLSHDDGYSWGERAPVYTAANGKDAGAPQVYNVGGTLVTSFMTNEAVNTPEVDGGQMKVVTSVNGATDWSSISRDGTVTGDKGSHWPGLYTIDDTHFLALYSMSGVGAVSQLYRVG